MNDSKCCDNCGYIGPSKDDDFFDYRKDGNEMTTCYFCLEMIAGLDETFKKSDKVNYQMFAQGMNWLLKNIRQINDGKK